MPTIGYISATASNLHDLVINNAGSIYRDITKQKLFTLVAFHYSMGFRSSATLNGASVLALISSTVTPSAISTSVKPCEKSTSNTPCIAMSVFFFWSKG